MNKKYELIKEDSIEIGGIKLYRIKSIKNFGVIPKDTLGGYIQSESNLSQKGFCWVDESAKIYGPGMIKGNVIIKDISIHISKNLTGSIEINKDNIIPGIAEATSNKKESIISGLLTIASVAVPIMIDTAFTLLDRHKIKKYLNK